MAEEDSLFDFEMLEKKLRDLLTDREVDDYRIIRPPNGGQKNKNFQRQISFSPSTSYENQQRIKFEELYKEYECNKNSSIFSSLCTFCKQNCEHPSVYLTHKLKEYGVVQCPILRKYVCPNCNATGDNAHTLKYCPLSSTSSKRAFHIAEAAKLRMSNGRKRK